MADRDVINFYIDRTRVRIKKILEKNQNKSLEKLRFALSRFVNIDGFQLMNSVFAEFCNITKIKPSELVFDDNTFLAINPGRNLEIYWNSYYAKRRISNTTQDAIKHINQFQVLIQTCLDYNIDIDDLFIFLKETTEINHNKGLIPKTKEYIEINPSSTYKEIVNRVKSIRYLKGNSIRSLANSPDGKKVLKTIYIGKLFCTIPTIKTIERICNTLQIKPSEFLSKDFDELETDYGYEVKWNPKKLDELAKNLNITKKQLLPVNKTNPKNLSLKTIIHMCNKFQICIDNFFEITKKEA